MKSMRFWNIIVSVIFSILGISFILLSSNFPVNLGTGDPGSGFWPSTLGLILIFLSILLLVESFISKSVKEKTITLSSQENKIVYIIMGASVLFCISTYYLGFIFSSFMFTYIFMSIFGITNRKEKLLTALSIVVLLYVVFTLMLKTSLPLPIFLR